MKTIYNNWMSLLVPRHTSQLFIICMQQTQKRCWHFLMMHSIFDPEQDWHFSTSFLLFATTASLTESIYFAILSFIVDDVFGFFTLSSPCLCLIFAIVEVQFSQFKFSIVDFIKCSLWRFTIYWNIFRKCLTYILYNHVIKEQMKYLSKHRLFLVKTETKLALMFIKSNSLTVFTWRNCVYLHWRYVCTKPFLYFTIARLCPTNTTFDHFPFWRVLNVFFNKINVIGFRHDDFNKRFSQTDSCHLGRRFI